MKNEFKFLPLCVLLVLLAGCASGSPIDFLIPTRKPSIATSEYLGHLYTTNSVNRLYHSLTDTKIESMTIPLRKIELDALYRVAKKETAFFEEAGNKVSNGLWGLVIAGVGALGWQTPRPQEKAKVIEALHATPPNATNPTS